MKDPNPRWAQVLAEYSKWIWVGTGGAIAVAETLAILDKAPGDTISETARWALHVHTKWGRFTWTVGWPTFAIWFFFHIRRVVRQAEEK